MPGCVTLLRTVHEVSGYPSVWPQDPAGWLAPANLTAAWVAETGGLISGHVALVPGAPAQAREHGLQPVLNVMADGHAAIALYERSGWKLAGTQPATWTTPDGVAPMMRYYVGP